MTGTIVYFSKASSISLVFLSQNNENKTKQKQTNKN